jgi:putative ubiquitin-RnfH superfamily antitoxin RatB of RatAB toxin-antitoxin module
MPTPKQATRCLVEIVAVLGGLNFRKTLPVPAQQTLGWAVNASGLYALAPQLRTATLGVWGKVLPPATIVAEGDRIEVYTPVNVAALATHRANLQTKKKSAKVETHE